MKHHSEDYPICPNCNEKSEWPIGSITVEKWSVVRCRLCKSDFRIFCHIHMEYTTEIPIPDADQREREGK